MKEKAKTKQLSFDQRIAAVAAQQSNVFSLNDIRRKKGSRKMAEGRTKNALWLNPHRSIYVLGAAALSFSQRCVAALAYLGAKALFSHRTAAFLEGLDGIAEPETLEVTMTQNGRHKLEGVHVYRSRRSIGRRRRARDLPVTPIERTLLDLAGVVDEETLERAVESAFLTKKTTAERVYICLVREGGRGVAGSALLWKVMHQRPNGRPARSYFEIRTGAALREAGLGHFVRNHPVTALDGEPFEIDAAFVEHRVAVESDGGAWHSTRTQRQKDKRRQAKLEAAGWTFRRVTYAETLTAEGRAKLVADIRALLGMN